MNDVKLFVCWFCRIELLRIQAHWTTVFDGTVLYFFTFYISITMFQYFSIQSNLFLSILQFSFSFFASFISVTVFFLFGFTILSFFYISILYFFKHACPENAFHLKRQRSNKKFWVIKLRSVVTWLVFGMNFTVDLTH